jgi:hypothetical protein
MYKVKNVNVKLSDFKYAVISKISENLWNFCGAYNSMILSQNKYNEVENGLIIEASKIEAI